MNDPPDPRGLLAGPRAISRGGSFLGFPEHFNRYYTDPTYTAARTRYVSESGMGDGTTRDAPTRADVALREARPGDTIVFVRGQPLITACYELTSGGTPDSPIVIRAEKGLEGGRGVEIRCCESERASCFNLEGANHVAIEGFVLTGGKYGARVVGTGYGASEHQRGVALLDLEGRDQSKDPFFSGQSDWLVIQGCVAHGAGKGDGHGIYLSNGGDWNIVRGNETYGNASSDLQINADPISTCEDEDLDVRDRECDGSARDGLGRGASEYFLVEANYLHDDNIGPNFTSLRNSIVRNNVSVFHELHDASFWQETRNPNLGSHDNLVFHNLFGGTSTRHALQFIEGSTRNRVMNNIIIGTDTQGTTSKAEVVLLETDASAADNVYEANLYIGGHLEGRSPGPTERAVATFDRGWFVDFAPRRTGRPGDFMTRSGSPAHRRAARRAEAPFDARGLERGDPTDLGPFQIE